MIVRFITVKVAKGTEQAFEEATTANHEASISEDGVLRFDVLHDVDDPGTYYLYEVYRDQEATALHKQTAHYAAWKATVEPMMGGPRTSVTATAVRPVSPDLW